MRRKLGAVVLKDTATVPCIVVYLKSKQRAKLCINRAVSLGRGFAGGGRQKNSACLCRLWHNE